MPRVRRASCRRRWPLAGRGARARRARRAGRDRRPRRRCCSTSRRDSVVVRVGAARAGRARSRSRATARRGFAAGGTAVVALDLRRSAWTQRPPTGRRRATAGRPAPSRASRPRRAPSPAHRASRRRGHGLRRRRPAARRARRARRSRHARASRCGARRSASRVSRDGALAAVPLRGGRRRDGRRRPPGGLLRRVKVPRRRGVAFAGGRAWVSGAPRPALGRRRAPRRRGKRVRARARASAAGSRPRPTARARRRRARPAARAPRSSTSARGVCGGFRTRHAGPGAPAWSPDGVPRLRRRRGRGGALARLPVRAPAHRASRSRHARARVAVQPGLARVGGDRGGRRARRLARCATLLEGLGGRRPPQRRARERRAARRRGQRRARRRLATTTARTARAATTSSSATSGNDRLYGGRGRRPRRTAGPATTRVRGGDGDDRLDGGAGDDRIFGEAGDDQSSTAASSATTGASTAGPATT